MSSSAARADKGGSRGSRRSPDERRTREYSRSPSTSPRRPRKRGHREASPSSACSDGDGDGDGDGHRADSNAGSDRMRSKSPSKHRHASRKSSKRDAPSAPEAADNPYLAHLSDAKPAASDKQRRKLEVPSSNGGRQTCATATDAEAVEDGDINLFTGRSFSSKYRKILLKRRELPVRRQRQQFLDIFSKNQIIVFIGETGSGKTTQIPQYLAYYLQPHLRGKMIACTQPRRVAAISVAKRVADEMDVSVGDEVGYSIRFEDNTSPKTFLKYMTDGMLLRELSVDRRLSRYDAIILDEAHERTVQTDLLMAFLKLLCVERPDLKLIVMSATLDAQKFQTYFNDAPLLEVPGRSFPVDILYLSQPADSYVDTAISVTRTVVLNEGPGDILIFLTGEEEIEDTCRRIRDDFARLKLEKTSKNLGDLVVYPLYSSLPPQQQQQIFSPTPPDARKVVVSTNIAETSVTIDGIVYVIDSGFVKQKIYSPEMRAESLQVTPISQAAANQRAGRAGRTRPGKCYRLYTEHAFHNDLDAQTPPETMRCNMSNVLLQLFDMQVRKVHEFDFMDPPTPQSFMRGLELLVHLGAIDTSGVITEVGKMMARFPLDPEFSKMIINAPKYGCVENIVTIVSMLNVPNVFVRPLDKRREADSAKEQFASHLGDHLTLLNVYSDFIANDMSPKWCFSNYLSYRALCSAESVRTQLMRMMRKFNLDTDEIECNILEARANSFKNLRKCILSGYILQAAKLNSKKSYTTLQDNMPARIHPSSTINPAPEYLLYSEYVLTSDDYLRTVLAIEPSWLAELLPSEYKHLNRPASHRPSKAKRR